MSLEKLKLLEWDLRAVVILHGVSSTAREEKSEVKWTFFALIWMKESAMIDKLSSASGPNSDTSFDISLADIALSVILDRRVDFNWGLGVALAPSCCPSSMKTRLTGFMKWLQQIFPCLRTPCPCDFATIGPIKT